MRGKWSSDNSANLNMWYPTEFVTLHIDGEHEHLATEVGLTLMRVMGMDIASWGKGTMQAHNSVDSILA